MKKMFSCMLLLLISMTLLLPVYAAFENPPIIDDAGYLMQSELDELSRCTFVNDVRLKKQKK